jgi:hypothetical protein
VPAMTRRTRALPGRGRARAGAGRRASTWRAHRAPGHDEEARPRHRTTPMTATANTTTRTWPPASRKKP